jgi:exodeoxyribonuclease VII large subunit
MDIISVSEVAHYLKELLETDELLSDIWLRGEVSNASRTNQSGHIYFTLKDSNAQIRCALFRNAAIRQTHLPRDGNSIIVHGNISIYEATGQLQLYVDLVQPDGIGKLSAEFALLKQKLEAEGLFAEERKRPLPLAPKIIGVVTSPTAAAFQDILNVLRRRYPLAQVVLSPTLVQGENAPTQIVAALERLNQRSDIDVIILARGGGSLEELWAFNDEKVARAVFSSRITVVTGVGHETDTTIVDYVSDLRAPTPSAAAELVSPNIEDIRYALSLLSDQMYTAVQDQIDENRSEIQQIQSQMRRVSPVVKIPNLRQSTDDLMSRAHRALKNKLIMERLHVQSIESRLKVMNPRQILARGYSILTNEVGTVITSAQTVQTGDLINAQLADGSIITEVKDKAT